jgi:hypothetical protein
MRPRRYPVASADPRELFPELVGVLIEGWATTVEDDRDDPFRIFDYSEAALAALWNRHQARLRQEAARRGIAPRWPLPDGRLGFFGEYLAALGAGVSPADTRGPRAGRCPEP